MSTMPPISSSRSAPGTVTNSPASCIWASQTRRSCLGALPAARRLLRGSTLFSITGSYHHGASSYALARSSRLTSTASSYLFAPTCPKHFGCKRSIGSRLDNEQPSGAQCGPSNAGGVGGTRLANLRVPSKRRQAPRARLSAAAISRGRCGPIQEHSPSNPNSKSDGGEPMKHQKLGFAVLLAAGMAVAMPGKYLLASTAMAQAPRALPVFEMEKDWPKVPPQWKVGDVSSFTSDAQGNIWL